MASPAPETQILRRPARLGVAVDGMLRWLPDGFRERRGEPAATAAPVADLTLESTELELEVWIETYVDVHAPVLVRRVQVTHRSPVQRSLTLYFHHDLRLADGRPHERARRDEASGGVLHVSGRRAVLFQIQTHEGIGVPLARIAARVDEGASGADAEAVAGTAPPRSEATGWVDSVGGVPIALEPGGAAMVVASLSIGATPEEARAVSEAFHRAGVADSLTRTRAHWTLWTSQGSRAFADLPEEVGNVFEQSLHVLRLHQTPEGAFVAPLDAARGTERSDAGRGCRLADAAVAADALGRAGYGDAARRYFAFVERAARANDYLAPVVDATGAAIAVPGEEDGALLADALHLWATARHFDRDRDVEALSAAWRAVLAPAALRLTRAVDPLLGLPASSDWWGERRGVATPVAGAVRGGLRAASRLAAMLGEARFARAWTLEADRIARETTRRLRDEGSGGFVRGMEATPEGWAVDTTLDASLLLLGLFDDFEPEDPRVRATVASVKRRLWAHTGSGGLIRYEGDRSGRSASGAPGEDGEQPRIAPTLWLALQEARAARRLQDLEPVRTLLFWAAARAEGSGLLPESIHPARGGPTGTAPSLSAHAWFVQASLDYADRVRLLTRCDRCGEPGPVRRERRTPAAPAPARSLPGIVAHL